MAVTGRPAGIFEKPQLRANERVEYALFSEVNAMHPAFDRAHERLWRCGFHGGGEAEVQGILASYDQKLAQAGLCPTGKTRKIGMIPALAAEALGGFLSERGRALFQVRLFLLHGRSFSLAMRGKRNDRGLQTCEG
jgi:hypothetical protein